MTNFDSDIKVILSGVTVIRFDDEIYIEVRVADEKGWHEEQTRLSRSDVADLIEFLTEQFDTLPQS